MNSNSTKIIGAALLGAVVGAGIAILYAPKSGRETRKDISKAARRLKKDAVELVEDTIKSMNEFVNDVKEKATDIIDGGIELSEGAKKEIVKTLEYGQKAIEKQKRRLIEGLGL
ncbi:MAG: YtxH domain-containing protein [Nitrospirota bacterium]